MTEERLKSLLAAKGHKNGEQAFKVPDGYFESLTERVMLKVTEHAEKPTKHVPLLPRTWHYAAAVAAVFLLATTTILVPQLLKKNDASMMDNELMAQRPAELLCEEDDGFEELDYVMVDNNEIAYYLTGY